MEKIRIYHAFNGFLYSPIFLADELGFFPKNTELVYERGDDKTIESLCSDGTLIERNCFAICDPFSVDLNTAMENTNDEICVIGSLVNTLPIWLFNKNENTDPVASESELQKYKGVIERIVSYPKGTTGYLIAKRIQGVLGLNDQYFIEKPFGKEFDDAVTSSTAIVTSDILRIAHHRLDRRNLIFSYPAHAPQELNPFLFTAILTLKSTVNSNLWTVLSVLGAIRAAIDCLSERNVDPRYLEALVRKFDTEQFGDVFKKLSIADHDQKLELIRTAVSYSFFTTKLYSQYPKPKEQVEWVHAWNNASTEWKRQNGERDYPAVTQKDEPIPALLVKREWKPGLLDYFKKELYGHPPNPLTDTPFRSAEFMKTREKAILVMGWFVALVSTILVFRAAIYTFAEPLRDSGKFLSKWQFWLVLLLLIGELVAFRSLRRALLKLSDYVIELTIFGIVVAALATFVFNLLEI